MSKYDITHFVDHSREIRRVNIVYLTAVLTEQQVKDFLYADGLYFTPYYYKALRITPVQNNKDGLYEMELLRIEEICKNKIAKVFFLKDDEQPNQ
jgi:hypothetical protein